MEGNTNLIDEERNITDTKHVKNKHYICLSTYGNVKGAWWITTM